MSREPTLAVHIGNIPWMGAILRALGQHVKVETRKRRPNDLRTEGEAHLMWGAPYGLKMMRELAATGRVFFAEQGWLPHRDGCYIEETGLHGDSTIRGALDLNPFPVLNDLDKRIKELHGRHDIQRADVATCGESGYVFVPLQVEKDSQVANWARITGNGLRGLRLVDAVCEAFPDERIVVRYHPADRDSGARASAESERAEEHGNVWFTDPGEGNTFQWLSRAKCVVGINSTVLIEALTFYLPVVALGDGVFSGNDVLQEGRDDPSVIRAMAGIIPNAGRIRQFLSLLWTRQIPYRFKSERIDDYPILQRIVEKAKELVE